MEKAGLIGLVQMHYLESNAEDLSIDGKTLADALRRDRESGLIPFWVPIGNWNTYLYCIIQCNVQGFEIMLA